MVRLKKYKWVRDGDFVKFKTDSGVHTLNERSVRQGLVNLVLSPKGLEKHVPKEDQVECLQWYTDALKLFL